METIELINNLSERLSIKFELDDDGVCAFEADGHLVSIHDLPELSAIALIGDLGTPPPERLEGLYAALLEANHLFRDTGGATLSRDAETGHIALCRALQRTTLSSEGFYEALEHFVSTVQAWAKVIRDYREAPPATENHQNSNGLDAFNSGFITG